MMFKSYLKTFIRTFWQIKITGISLFHKTWKTESKSKSKKKRQVGWSVFKIIQIKEHQVQLFKLQETETWERTDLTSQDSLELLCAAAILCGACFPRTTRSHCFHSDPVGTARARAALCLHREVRPAHGNLTNHSYAVALSSAVCQLQVAPSQGTHRHTWDTGTKHTNALPDCRRNFWINII